MNKFSASVINEFEKMIADLERKGKAGEIEALIFRSGKPGNFIAGADINMIAATKTAEEAYTLSRKGQKFLFFSVRSPTTLPCAYSHPFMRLFRQP